MPNDGKDGAPDLSQVVQGIQDTQKAILSQLGSLKETVEYERVKREEPEEVEEPVIDVKDQTEVRPEDIARIAESAATKIVEKKVQQINVVSALKAEYPELADDDHDLTKLALANFKALPKEERTARGMEFATLRAATKLGIRPVGQRDEDGFLLTGDGSGRRRKADPNALPEHVNGWAEKLGRDPSKVKGFMERTRWSKYQGKPATTKGGKK